MAGDWQRGEYTISTDPSRLDIAVIHGFLRTSYWAADRPIEVIKRSIEHSLCFGLYKANEQVGFTRVVTDYATFAWVADVFVLEEHRGRGLAKWLMETIVSHPQLQGLKRWLLGTRDAHGLYEQFGFETMKSPERYMLRTQQNEKTDNSGGAQ